MRLLQGLLALILTPVAAFVPASPSMRATTLGTTTADPTAHAPRDLSAGTRAMTTTTALGMAQGDNDDESFMKWARAARYATDADEVVELPRPLGLILNQDPATGNVYVEKVAPRGNAARSGKVQEGDIVTMCSATFGDEMWSCRGVGLTRVLAAIKVRAGPVRLVFESPKKYAQKKTLTAKQVKAKQDAAAAAQAKKDQLLQELENDEKRLNKKWFGLF